MYFLLTYNLETLDICPFPLPNYGYIIKHSDFRIDIVRLHGRYFVGRHSFGGQLQQDMRAKLAPAIVENPQEFRFEAVRRVRGAAVFGKTTAKEAEKQRTVQSAYDRHDAVHCHLRSGSNKIQPTFFSGRRAEGDNRESPGNGRQVWSLLRHDNHQQRYRTCVSSAAKRNQQFGKGTAMGAGHLGENRVVAGVRRHAR